MEIQMATEQPFTPFSIAQEVLEETRKTPDTPRSHGMQTFIEEYVLSTMSVDKAKAAGIQQVKKLPETREIEWKDPRTRQEFNNLWKKFETAGSPDSAKQKLHRLYLLYKHRAGPYKLRVDTWQEMEGQDKPH